MLAAALLLHEPSNQEKLEEEALAEALCADRGPRSVELPRSERVVGGKLIDFNALTQMRAAELQGLLEKRGVDGTGVANKKELEQLVYTVYHDWRLEIDENERMSLDNARDKILPTAPKEKKGKPKLPEVNFTELLAEMTTEELRTLLAERGVSSAELPNTAALVRRVNEVWDRPIILRDRPIMKLVRAPMLIYKLLAKIATTYMWLFGDWAMPIVVVVVLSLAIEMQAVRNRNSNRWFWERESVELSNVAVMAAVLLGVCYAGTHLNVRQKLEWLVMECVSAWRWTVPAVIAVPVVVVLELRTQKLRKRSR